MNTKDTRLPVNMSLTSQLIVYYINQVSMFVGFPILVCGMIGNSICSIVFLSLRTFRTNPCAFYLTVASFMNNGHLMFGFFTRLMVNSFNIDWTNGSLLFCKLRPWLSQFSIMLSITCLCLATFDQYLATCSNNHWRQRSNLKFAYRLSILATVCWCIHGIPFILTYRLQNHICSIYDSTFYQYNRIIYIPILTCSLPLLIMFIFSCLSLRNIRQMDRYTVPVIRRELDKQLSHMTLVQALFTMIISFPFISYYVYLMSMDLNSLSVISEQQLILVILNMFWHAGFSAPFYIYYCSSRRFRRQFHFVISRFSLYLCRQACVQTNRVAPEQIAVTLPTVLPDPLTNYRRTGQIVVAPRRDES